MHDKLCIGSEIDNQDKHIHTDKYNKFAFQLISNSPKPSNEIDSSDANINDESKMDKTITSKAAGSHHTRNKIRCESCGKTFGSEKYLMRHIEKCHNQEGKCKRNKYFYQCHGKLRDEKESKNNICRLCMKNYKYKSGLIKHMEQSHYKTTSSWNGSEFVPAVQISLTSKQKGKQKKDRIDHKITIVNEKPETVLPRCAKKTKVDEFISEEMIINHANEHEFNNQILDHKDGNKFNPLSTNPSVIFCDLLYSEGLALLVSKLLGLSYKLIVVPPKFCHFRSNLIYAMVVMYGISFPLF